MAYERDITKEKVKGDSLDAFVENLSSIFATQFKVRNAEDELEFHKQVLESGIPLESQLAYRQEQLKRVSDDPDERRRIKAEISTLKDKVEQKKFSDDYLSKLIDFESGISSVDSVISWLESQKNSSTNQTVKDAINKSLVEKQSEKFTLTKQLLENQTTYAMKDKSEAVIEAQLKKVTAARANAILSGDQTLQSTYDLQIQALTKELNENGIQKDIQNFATAAITGYSSAVGLLDSYNSKISGSTAVGSVTIGGVTYASPKEFWTFKRDSYVADSSSAGFFSKLGDEVNTKIKVDDSKNTLSVNSIADDLKVYDRLAGRPELQGYDLKLQATRQESVQTGTNLVADTVTNRYARDYDINKAVTELNSLNSLGGKTDSAFTKLVTSASNLKTTQVSNILAVANDLISQGMPINQAISKAVAQGAGTVVSPEEAAGKSEADIAAGFAKGFKNESFATDPRTTIAPPTTPPNQPTGPTTPQTTPQPNTLVSPTAPATPLTPQPQAAPAAQQFKTITIKAGDTLSGIALRELGSAGRFKELADINKLADPNKIQAGGSLKIPTS